MLKKCLAIAIAVSSATFTNSGLAKDNDLTKLGAQLQPSKSALVGNFALTGLLLSPPPPPTPPPPPPDPVFSESCVQKELSRAMAFPAELAGIETTGTVHVLLIVNPCGEVKRALLDKTSGNPILDKAAIEGVLKWVLSPASLGFDKGQGGLVRAPVTFEETARP